MPTVGFQLVSRGNGSGDGRKDLALVARRLLFADAAIPSPCKGEDRRGSARAELCEGLVCSHPAPGGIVYWIPFPSPFGLGRG